jgi:hypothetical protein
LEGEAGLIACVISAQGDHQQLESAELAGTCHDELSTALGGLPAPEWTQVIAEKRHQSGGPDLSAASRVS